MGERVDKGPKQDVLRLTWVDHPAKDRPGMLWLAAGIIAIFSASVVMADGDLPLAIVSAMVLIVSIAPFLLPTRYTLTRHEVIVSMPGFTRRRKWADLRRWQERGDGILVSPFDRPRWLDSRRGLILRGGDRQAVLEFLSLKLGSKDIEE